MIPLARLVAILLVAFVSGPTGVGAAGLRMVSTAVVAAADPTCNAQIAEDVCTQGANDGFDVGTAKGSPGNAGVVPATTSGAGPDKFMRTEIKVVPACDGNDAVTDLGLCPGAVETCPNAGEMRYWQYGRTVDLREPAGDPPFQRVIIPPSVCLGPDDPRIDPTVAIPAIVEREFKRVVVLKGVATVNPAPETLVNFETQFSTAAPANYDIPLTLLGQSVVITARAESWTWHFGDGTQAHSTQGGRAVHTYVTTGARQAYIVIEWSGTYRIGASPTVRQVTGTATTTGDPAEVLVRQARTELVDQP